MLTIHQRFAGSILAACAFLSTTATCAYGQTVPLREDTIEYIFIHSPAFTIYKNNYVITGMQLDEGPSKETSDVKLQFSFKQRLVNKRLPLGTYLHLIYTQKSFWDIYNSSSPFRETNYNPGLLVVRPLFKDSLLTGALAFSFEHESNGRDSIYSRSWNFLSASYNKVITRGLGIGIKLWIPIIKKYSNNPDLPDYIGYGEGEVHWAVRQKIFLDVVARANIINLKGSIQADLSYKISKIGNQYLVVQWWHGYAESLIDYNVKGSMIRIGVMFKPTYYRFY